jgi:hypothetical protein
MLQEAQSLAVGAVPRFDVHGLPDEFVEHGARNGLLADLGLDVDGISERIRGMATKVADRSTEDSGAVGDLRDPSDSLSSAMESAS